MSRTMEVHRRMLGVETINPNVGGQKPSHWFTKYFKNEECVNLVGKTSRFVKHSDKEFINYSFVEFLDENKIDVNVDKYRMTKTNMEASFMSISKYNKEQPVLDEDAFKEACEWLYIHFSPHMGDAEVMETKDVLVEMDKTTTIGFPWNKKFVGSKNKKSVFLETPLVEIFNLYWNDLLCDDRYIPIWTCSQKFELRPLTKLQENKIRTFTASPVELTVVGNRLFLDMNERFYDAVHKTWSCVGITKYSGEWDKMFQRLNKHPNAFALDESDYDASLFEQILRAVSNFRKTLYSSNIKEKYQTDKRIDKIYDDIIHSLIVLESGEIIQKHTGNPSGCPNTVVDNTLCLFILLAYAWIVLWMKRGMGPPSYDCFMKNVEASLYGDDNTFTVSDEVVTWFNAEAIISEWKIIGITTKTDDVKPRNLIDTDFLSQKFVFDTQLNMVLPLPDAEKVLGSLKYGATLDDIRYHLLRAHALRMDSWPNVQCRKIINDYIMWLERKYKDELVGYVSLKNGEVTIDVSTILNMKKSDDYLAALYTGYESNCASIGYASMLKHVL